MISVAEIVFKDIEKNEDYEIIIEKVMQKCFEVEKINPTSMYVCVTLTTPKNIRKINKKYRSIDKATDVLSFPMFEKEELTSFNTIVQEVLGDIIISIDRVKKQATEYGHSFERELAYMLVHGFYHLMGYDHMEDEDRKIMRKKEEYVLNSINITR